MRSVFLRERLSQGNGDYFGQYIPNKDEYMENTGYAESDE